MKLSQKKTAAVDRLHDVIRDDLAPEAAAEKRHVHAHRIDSATYCRSHCLTTGVDRLEKLRCI